MVGSTSPNRCRYAGSGHRPDTPGPSDTGKGRALQGAGELYFSSIYAPDIPASAIDVQASCCRFVHYP